VRAGASASSGIDAVGDSGAAGVGPGEFPDFLRRAPERAEALGPVSGVRFETESGIFTP